VTVLRDPLERLVSLYSDLAAFAATGVRRPDDLFYRSLKHEAAMTQGGWLGFLDVAPRDLLLNQVAMFSPSLDPGAAAARAMACQAVLTTERLDVGLQQMGRALGLTLRPRHERVSGSVAAIDQDGLERARELLAPEYEFIARVEQGLMIADRLI
jgi:hypothetical protein